MYRLASFLLLTSVFYSCKKGELFEKPAMIIEPTGNLVLEQDSISTGAFWGLQIGSTSEEVYEQIQSIKNERQIRSVEVADNFFTSVNDLDSRLSLYNSLRLDRQQGSPEGVQVYFANNKIKSIYLNTGKALSKWPDEATDETAIHKGDEVKDIYPKLLAASKQEAYHGRFERLWLISKNIDKQYDGQMAHSNQWYFGGPLTGKKAYRVFLKFDNGRLITIHYSLILAL